MTQPLDLAAFEARVEAATEGSRELDALIWGVIQGLTAVGLTMTLGGSEELRTPRGEELRFPEHPWPGNYTTSVDAALALIERVLPGARCMVEREFDGRSWAMIQPGIAAPREQIDGATPAIALCAAALRALQAKQTGADHA